MNKISAAAISALLIAATGLGAAAPAFAQDHRPPMQRQMEGHGDRQHHQENTRHRGAQRGGGMGGFLDFERGSEALEIALVRLSYRLELTPEQQTLFDDLRTTALSAAQTYADAAQTARPAGATSRPGMADALKQRIALETAHLAALTSVEPKLTAFFASLTPEQQASLSPRRGQRDRDGWNRPQAPAPQASPDASAPGAAPAQPMPPAAPDAPAPASAPAING